MILMKIINVVIESSLKNLHETSIPYLAILNEAKKSNKTYSCYYALGVWTWGRLAYF